MNPFECQHVDLWYGAVINYLLQHGDLKTDRTGVGTLSASGASVRFDLQKQAPFVTLKKTNLEWSFGEMEWFLSGKCDNVRWLQERGIPIWDNFADDDGNVGPIYGVQWRHWKTPSKHDGLLRQEPREVDQVAAMLRDLLTDPWSRRMIVEGWNPQVLPDPAYKPREQAALGRMALPPCHKSFQAIMRNKEDPVLDLVVYIRSSDTFLGLPFNIAQYTFLTHALAKYVGAKVGHLVVHLGDVHLYLNHVDQARKLVDRWEKTTGDIIVGNLDLPRPQLQLPGERQLPWDIDTLGLIVSDYTPQGFLGGPIAV